MSNLKTFIVVLSFLIASTFILGGMFTSTATAEEVKRISKEELKSRLDEPNLVILDVRRGYDWKASQRKIKGAKREGSNVNELMKKYSKDITIVLY